MDEIKTINIELEHSVAKLLLKNENLRKEREHFKSIYKDLFDSIRKTHVQSKGHCDSLIAQINEKSVENSNLNAQLPEKDFAITTLKSELRKLKGKNIINIVVSKPSVTIAPGMIKLDIEPISHRPMNNTDAHEELLVYVAKTCLNLIKPCVKLATIAPMNKDKKVRFAEPINSSSSIHKRNDSLKTKDSNKPLFTFIGVKPTTSASRSKSLGNTKNNRITRPPSSNQKNKVEDHSRKVKYSLNKMKSVSKPVSNALFKQSMRNAQFKSICAICNHFLFDGNRDMCIMDYVNDVNVIQIVLCFSSGVKVNAASYEVTPADDSFYCCLPSEWNTHVVVWRNKPDLDKMSFDDLYNNFKIVEQEVKGTTSSSSSLNSRNIAFVSSPSSTNEVNTAYGVSTANSQANPASTQVNTASTQVKENPKKDKIISKPNKNGRRGETEKSQKQLQ
nr:hypothetical protein [Tanacetum cinerariifolium]